MNKKEGLKKEMNHEETMHHELLAIYQAILNSSLQWHKEGKAIIRTTRAIFTLKEKNILKRLFILPMPPEYRKDFWMIASGARREMRNYPNYYHNLSQNYPKDIPSPYKKQIEVDLLRTCPDDDFFKDEGNIAMMRNILLTYSRRSITIGYCQGFNYIVGKILKIFQTEEETFWLLTQIIEHLLPPNYFSELAEMMTDCTVLTKLLESNETELINHLIESDAEIYLNNCIYQWFMSLFIKNTHELLWQAIWDIFMLEGNIVLFKAPIAILKLGLDDLLKVKTSLEIQSIFLNKIQLNNNVKYLLYYLLMKKFNFNHKTIRKNRALILPRVIEDIKGNRSLKIHNDNSEKCDPNWPLCTKDVNFRYEISQYFIYRQQKGPMIVQNYFGFNVNRKELKKNYYSTQMNNNNNDMNDNNNNGDNDFTLFNQILVERRKHTCQMNTNNNCNSNSHNSIIEPKSKNSNSELYYIEKEERDEKKMTTLIDTLKKKNKIELSPHLIDEDEPNENDNDPNNKVINDDHLPNDNE